MEVFDHTFASMNTRLSLLIPGLARREGERLLRPLGAALRAQERLMSRFCADAELFAVNARAAAGPVRVSRALWAILLACADHWRRTEGAFDVACGGAGGATDRASFKDVRLDPARRAVTFGRPDVRLDLGGVGKGVALRRVDQILRRRGVAHAFVSFGESSILAVGSRPGGGEWRIALDAPPTREGHAPALSIRQGSISTSGQVAGRAPIIDPATGRAAPAGRLVSVACDCPIDAEVLSTALLARPERRSALLARYRPAGALEIALSGREALATSQVLWTHG